MSNNNEKIEKRQSVTKIEIKKKKASNIEQKIKEQKNENPQNQNKVTIKNFEKILITEKDNFNKSQKNFLESNKIKIGER